jgi:hypothetical protein
MEPGFGVSEHVGIQLHTSRVRVALTSTLTGVLLTKRLSSRSGTSSVSFLFFSVASVLNLLRSVGRDFAHTSP